MSPRTSLEGCMGRRRARRIGRFCSFCRGGGGGGLLGWLVLLFGGMGIGARIGGWGGGGGGWI